MDDMSLRFLSMLILLGVSMVGIYWIGSLVGFLLRWLLRDFDPQTQHGGDGGAPDQAGPQ